jgi:hypothetical protein
MQKETAMRLRLLLPALFLSLAAPADSRTEYIARNGLVVIAETSRTFNVPFRGLSGDSEFWCAVGDFVQRGLGMPGGTLIFRLSEPPRRQGQGIRFSLDPEGAASRTGLLMISNNPPGAASAALAFGLCATRVVPRGN